MHLVVCGLPGSGKRHFTGVLVLSLRMRDGGDVSAVPGDGESELEARARYSLLETRLRHYRQCLPTAYRHPRVRVSQQYRSTGVTLDVVTELDPDQGKLLSVLGEADGLLLLVDPSPFLVTQADVAATCHSRQQGDPEIDDGARRGDWMAVRRSLELRETGEILPHEILVSSVVQTLRSLEASRKPRFRKPLALVFTKSDLHREAASGSWGSYLRSKPGMDALMRPCEAYFSRHAVFWCSALGSEPKGGNLPHPLSLPKQDILAPFDWLVDQIHR